MPSIESSIGTVASTGNQQLRRYVVDDPTDIPDSEVVNPHYKAQIAMQQAQQMQLSADKEKEIYDQVNELKKQKTTIAPDKKRKLEALLGLRRITKTINIDGINITLRNLNANDTKIAYKTIAKNSVTNIDVMFYSRNTYLALSLFEIDGEKISDILEEKLEPDIELRLSLIEEMDEGTVKQLSEFYEKEIGIKLPQTEEEIREVQAEIKK